MIVPSALLLLCHLVQAAVLIAILIAPRPQWQQRRDGGGFTVADSNATAFANATELPTDGGNCRFSTRLYAEIYLAVVCLCLPVELLTAWFSLAGSVLRGLEKRRPVAWLLYCRLVLLLAEFSWLFYVAISLIRLRYSDECSHWIWPVRALTTIVAFSWIIMLLTVLAAWCTFDQSGRVWMTLRRAGVKRDKVDAGSSAREPRDIQPPHQLVRRNSWKRRDALVQYERIWDRRFRRFFCCIRPDDRNARATFGDVAKLFSEFFRDLDVVPTDVAAGLILLRAYQKERAEKTLKDPLLDVRAFMSGRPVLSTTRFFQPGDSAADASQMAELVFHMKLALAAYGCPMLAYTGNCCCLVCQLRICRPGGAGCCCLCSCCCCGRQQPGATARASVEALLRRHGVGPADFELLHVSQELPDASAAAEDAAEAADCPPFYVGIDKVRRRLVVAIRGTLCMRDVLTDLRADAEQIAAEGAAESASCSGHSGIVRAADQVRRLLAASGWLNAAPSEQEEPLPLVLTGHSLGAGVAAVLGLQMHSASSRSVRVLAYSPPGGLLCPSGADACRDYVISVVVGKDVVCRLGLAQLEGMRAAMSELLGRSSETKWRLICCGVSPAAASTADNRVILEGDERSLSRCIDWHSTAPPLCMPGRILHLVRALRPPSPAQWRAVWASRDDFDELLVSPSMLRDHMPDCVLEALEQLAAEVGFGADEAVGKMLIA